MKVDFTLRGCAGLLLLALLTVAGCTPREGARPQPEAGPDPETSRDETIERKAPPFFIYRPGSGLTIEGTDGDWLLRL